MRRDKRFATSKAISSYRGDTPFMVDDHIHWQSRIVAHCQTAADAELIVSALNAWWESMLQGRTPHICEACS